MPPSDSAAVRTVPDTVAAHAQAVLNRDNGVSHVAGLLDRGVDRLTAWSSTATRIHAAVSQFPAHAACEFLAHVVAATQMMLVEQDTPNVDSYPQLEPGMTLIRTLSSRGMSPLDVWLTLSNRTCNATHAVVPATALLRLSDLVAAGQLLLAEQRR